MICHIAVFYVELLTQRAFVRKNFALQVRQPWLLPRLASREVNDSAIQSTRSWRWRYS